MSVSVDFLISTDTTLADIQTPLARECNLHRAGYDRIGNPTSNGPDFNCFITAIDEERKTVFQEHLGFKPTFRIECYANGESDHGKIWPEFYLTLVMCFDGDIAWLNECSTPVIVKHNDQLMVQNNLSPYSYWSGLLQKIADNTGLPYKMISLPSF